MTALALTAPYPDIIAASFDSDQVPVATCLFCLNSTGYRITDEFGDLASLCARDCAQTKDGQLS
jgi:hypothetical protein